MPDHRTKRVFALLQEAELTDRNARLRLFSWITYRNITTTNDLSHFEMEAIVNCLSTWQKSGDLQHNTQKYSQPTVPDE